MEDPKKEEKVTRDGIEPEVLSFDEFLHKRLNVRNEFFKELHDDNDWTFIVKLHALVEGALARLLINKFRCDRLEEVFRNLDNSDPRRGRVAFIAALELLPEEFVKFIICFSELRNKFAHSIKHLDTTLEQFFEDMPRDSRNKLVKSIDDVIERQAVTLPDGRTGMVDDHREFIRTSPRFAILLAVHRLMVGVYCMASENQKPVKIQLDAGAWRVRIRAVPKTGEENRPA